MPGGEDYRKWYAMRARLKAAGKWKGKTPTHFVPQLEEGEPRPKEPALGPIFERAADPTPESSPNSIVGPSDAETVGESTPDSLPPLEDSPTAEGNDVLPWLFFATICSS
nr:hypothetical protein [Bird parvovirus]